MQGLSEPLRPIPIRIGVPPHVGLSGKHAIFSKMDAQHAERFICETGRNKKQAIYPKSDRGDP
jgi:hypothetical protein